MTSPGIIEFREVPVPGINTDQVLVKIMSIGICGSDIHVYRGEHPYTSYPVVQGHEVSCTVEEIGKNVTGFKKGDRVAIEPQVSCGECYACTHGMYNICDELKVLGFQTTGTASDYFAVSANKLVKLPDTMDFSHGAMMEPLAVAVRAVSKAGDMKDKKVVVLGAGPIGNLVAQTARAMGAARVISVDLNEFRLKKASACGIDRTVNSGKEDLKSAIEKTFGKYEMADVFFECAGAAATMTSSLTLARKGTPVVVVAVFGEIIGMDMALVNENELTLIGTARYVIEDFSTAIQLVNTGRVKLSPIITDYFDFNDFGKAYKRIKDEKEKVMKVIIRVNE
jgi:L-iditol 2-dehydrogenase